MVLRVSVAECEIERIVVLRIDVRDTVGVPVHGRTRGKLSRVGESDRSRLAELAVQGLPLRTCLHLLKKYKNDYTHSQTSHPFDRTNRPGEDMSQEDIGHYSSTDLPFEADSSIAQITFVAASPSCPVTIGCLSFTTQSMKWRMLSKPNPTGLSWITGPHSTSG